MTSQTATTSGCEHWDVWHDVEDGNGNLDSEMKEFRSYAAALRFAAKHESDERPAAIDHYNADDQLI